jgi:hypothetical protein
MTPRELLAAAQNLLDQPQEGTQGLWSRGAALLLRQALERGMAELLADRTPGAQAATFATQLVVLPEVLGDAALGRRVGWTWSALTCACHAGELRLPPTVDELKRWGEVVGDLVAANRY